MPACRTARRARPARRSLVHGLAALGLLALPSSAQAQALEQKLIAPDGAATDRLHAAAVDGDTAVVGAPRDDGQKGAVYVFTRSGDSWTQTAKLTASDGAAGDRLGDHGSVAIDGDTIVAAAFGDDIGTNADQGSVYTFARTGAATRQETAKLTVSDGAALDYLGYYDAVAVEGDTIVVGSSFADIGANADQGAVYTFARTGAGTRQETAKLTATAGAVSDQLGLSVDLDGDTIVAGVMRDDVGANADQGAVYAFARTGAATRQETARLTASDGAKDDLLGVSVGIDGDTIVAGTNYDDIGANEDQGSVYTFARTGAATRQETAKLTAGDGAEADYLGEFVAVDGDTIVSGARFADIGAITDQGAVYAFARTGAATRQQTAKLTADDGAKQDYLGYPVAIDGDTIVGGAPGDDVGAKADQGSASIFFSPAPTGGGGQGGGGGGGGGGDDAAPTCAGRTATIVGTSADDAIVGTGRADVIVGLGGNDRILGGGGRDIVCGGVGRDRIEGGTANDRLSGGAGPDRLFGNAGNDRLNGDRGNDRLAGGPGRDRLSGARGADRLGGGPGPDRLNGGLARDQLNGGGARDRCNGGAARDRASRCERRLQIP